MDSDDELGAAIASTPFNPKKRPANSKPTSTSSVAGPSKPRPRALRGKPNGRQKLKPSTPSVEVVSSARSESEAEAVPTERARPKAKGKEKAVRPARSGKKAIEPIVVEHDTDDAVVQATEVDDHNDTHPQKSKAPRGSTKFKEGLVRRLELCQQQLAESESRNETLSKQLHELLSIRETEPEELLASKTRLYESMRETQEKMSLELTSQLARIEPLSRPGGSSVLHLMTREAVDVEKRLLEEDIAQWKANASEKDRLLDQANKKIAELEQIQNELRFELSQVAAEKTRTTTGPAGSHQNHASGKGQSALPDPKFTEIIKFYEDLTDLLVTRAQHDSTSKSGKDEWLLTCVYSCSETDGISEESDGQPKPPSNATSLNFTLRTCWESTDDNPDQLKQTVHFVPLNLKNERQEFVKKLEFLSSPFTFERSQLALFLRTLRDNMDSASKEEDSEEELYDNSVEVVE